MYLPLSIHICCFLCWSSSSLVSGDCAPIQAPSEEGSLLSPPASFLFDFPMLRQAGSPCPNTGSVLSPHHRGVLAPLYAQILAILSLCGATYYQNCMPGSHLHWLSCSQLGVGLPSGPGPLPLDWLAQGCPLVVKQVLGWVWRSPARGPPWDMKWNGLQQYPLTTTPVHFHLLPCCLGG